MIVPVSFNFPHAGKLLSLSFIPFAAWFSDAALRLRDYPQLFGAGLLSFFGSLNSAVPFLLDLFDLPADTFQLFLATGVINSRFGTLVAAMHTVTVAILGSVAVTVGIRWQFRRLMRFGVATAIILAVTLIGLRVLFATALRQEFAGADIVYSMQPLLGGAPAPLEPAAAGSRAAGWRRQRAGRHPRAARAAGARPARSHAVRVSESRGTAGRHGRRDGPSAGDGPRRSTSSSFRPT